jgi:hypothetical protein
VLRKPFDELRTFTRETPVRPSREKENLDGEPKGKEEKVRKQYPAPTSRNRPEHLVDQADN